MSRKYSGRCGTSEKPSTTVTAKDVDGCVILINGKQGKKSSRLKDGDQVLLMSPVCGG